MKIGIISDTHIHKNADKINQLIEIYFRDVDMLIHAGDYTDRRVVEQLKKYPNFKGVWGNVDKDSTKELLNEKEIIEVEGVKIGIFHGHGQDKTTLERAYDKFKADKPDIVIFGHSHQPYLSTKGKVLMINPGSITYKRQERWHSYIILEIQNGLINVGFRLFK